MADLQSSVNVQLIQAAQSAQQATQGPTAEEKQISLQAEEDSFPGTACCYWCTNRASCAQRCSFITWFIFAALAIVFLGIEQEQEQEYQLLNWGYFLCAALSMILSYYAVFQFSGLQDLIDMVKQLKVSVKALTEQNERVSELTKELRLTRARLAVIETQQTIKNAELLQQEALYKEWMKNAEGNEKNTARFVKTAEQDLIRRIQASRRSIVQREKAMLQNAFIHFSSRDNQPGLSELEYAQFVQALPRRYSSQFTKKSLTFGKFAGDDGVMDVAEFTDFLKDLVVSEVEISQARGFNITGLDSKSRDRNKKKENQKPS